MILKTKDINIYYLTTKQHSEKTDHISKILSGFNVNQVLPFELSVGKEKSGSIGHARMIEAGLRDQEISKPFQPFIILEDDISLYREIPEEIDIPDQADMTYLGLSQLAMKKGQAKDDIFAKQVDENLFRIFNMLSGHAILICSALGAAAYQKAMIDGFYQKKIWDVFAAEIQDKYNIYALKKPIFFQDKKYGGREAATNFELDNEKYSKKVYSNPEEMTESRSTFFYNSASIRISSQQKSLSDKLKDLPEIPKKIHVSWKDKDILKSENQLIKNGIKNLKSINQNWTLEISDDKEVDYYLEHHLSKKDFNLIKNAPIVPKVDVWRLLKMIHEGGLYMDIDRHANKNLDEIILEQSKCVLPMHKNHGKVIDFSQDIMISAPGNPIHKAALDLNLRRRRSGWTDILTLAPITYFHALTEFITGTPIDRYPNEHNLEKILNKINSSSLVQTFIEEPPNKTFIFEFNSEEFDFANGLGKEALYEESNVEHWGVKNPIIKKEMKFK